MTISSEFLEAVNGTQFIMYVGVALIFIQYIAMGFIASIHNEFEFYKSPTALLNGVREGYSTRKAAIGFLIFVLGDTLIRGSIWFMRHKLNDGEPIGKGDTGIFTLLILTGAIIVIIGSICILRNISPAKWKHWPAVIITATALIFGIGFAYL
jgi:hypothetical protein